jgi:hypothetical protein
MLAVAGSSLEVAGRDKQARWRRLNGCEVIRICIDE